MEEEARVKHRAVDVLMNERHVSPRISCITTEKQKNCCKKTHENYFGQCFEFSTHTHTHIKFLEKELFRSSRVKKEGLLLNWGHQEELLSDTGNR
jgi:hypothetical protein